jgi:hypothetical protein
MRTGASGDDVIDDFYQAALAKLRHHLDEAGARYTLDDGEIVLDGHRLGLSITFEGFVKQGEHTLAPLDIQIHVDGDSGDRFRVGTLGVGTDPETAKQDALSEWHMLVVVPLLAALGAPVEKRRGAAIAQQKLAGWDLFAGRVGIRGRMPAGLGSQDFYRSLLGRFRELVSKWEQPSRFELRSIFVMASCSPEGREIQAAVDGLVSEELTQLLEAVAWPDGHGDAYLYKQLFALRHDPVE